MDSISLINKNVGDFIQNRLKLVYEQKGSNIGNGV